ncbi:YjbH domain-containing protein [Yoonia sp.]|uniref:YjbH domain-containing protein n=1 Tax=Yoonia sp. TaxID=2212373 RepID=UPI001A06C4ED|nr:YjbH domain-containing protein [Yoonia sp.]MBE0412430.1 YjbH domain-containing protein [Yoonia sp.]
MRYNTFGASGLIDMPVASSAPDAELAFTLSSFARQTRNTLTFQASPRLSASFRYAALRKIMGQHGVIYDRILDRSLALHYRILDETRRRPAVAVGVADFIGTGIYGGEYLVATKALRPDLAVTLGVGWGRYAGVGGFANPLGPAFADRPDRVFAQGGTITRNAFFRGDVAFFGGVQWQPTPKLGVTLEYSSDRYPYEDPAAFVRRTPFNFGLNYTLRPGVQVAAQYLYGAEFGAQLTFALNPTRPPHGSGYARGPATVRAGTPLARALAAEGLVLTGAQVVDGRMDIAVQNTRFPDSAQAIGRAARVLAQIAPKGIDAFAITLDAPGLRGPAVVLQRSDLATLEFAPNGTAQIGQQAEFATAAAGFDNRYPVFDWSLRPYITPNLFDPDDPLRADVGIALDAQWQLAAGVIGRATVQQRLAGNLDQTVRKSDSALPHVRSDFALYEREGNGDIAQLALHWYAQPLRDVATRVSIGLFETMYGGMSSEVLWYPGGRDLAFGIELNALRQRDYDGGLGFRDDAMTSGHASIYWQGKGGYSAQLDAGRYLAGDWGGTLTLARQFRNGWSLGAFATLTDVPFETFGEGSFDKGIVLTVPLSWVSGRPRRDALATTLRPVTRDGGARVQVDGRLYPLTAPLRARAINDSWGMFWR